MAKKKKTRRTRKFTLPLALIGGVAGMRSVRDLAGDVTAGRWNLVPVRLGNIVGVQADGSFDFGLLKDNILPLMVGMIVHKMAVKFGVNRALGRAGVPIIRF